MLTVRIHLVLHFCHKSLHSIGFCLLDVICIFSPGVWFCEQSLLLLVSYIAIDLYNRSCYGKWLPKQQLVQSSAINKVSSKVTATNLLANGKIIDLTNFLTPALRQRNRTTFNLPYCSLWCNLVVYLYFHVCETMYNAAERNVRVFAWSLRRSILFNNYNYQTKMKDTFIRIM